MSGLVSDETTEVDQTKDGLETPRAEDDSLNGVRNHDDAAAAAAQLLAGGATSNSAASSPAVQLPHRTVSASEDSYFAPRPMHYHSAHLSIPEDEELSVSPSSRRTAQSPSFLKATRASAALTSEHAYGSPELHERPPVHRDYSAASTISNASTIRASEHHSYLPLSQTRSRDAPQYPNQAYAALQSQYHPAPPSPHYLRSRGSHPSPHLAYRAYSETGSPSPDEPRAQQSSSRAPSAASSPGLFTPKAQMQRPQVTHAETVDGTYASPYLHHTHRQMPKETHLAEIEYDPISGRKMINQYEIIDELGRGVHGKVKLGRNLTDGSYVAIKIVERYSKRRRLGKNHNHESKIKKEIAILKKARHHNIVGLLEVIDDPHSKKVYIVLEHVEMGEVAWRTEGAPEICWVEHRRFVRKAEGKFDDEASRQEDEKILEEAHKHIEKHDRRQWRKIKQQRIAGGADVPSWSLEHGDDDDDDLSNGNMSRVPSATTSLSHSAKQSFIDQHQFPRPDQTVIHYEQTLLSNHKRQNSDYHLSEHGHADTAGSTGLEGTMYGAYDIEIPRGRTPSIAGSTSSAGFERDLLEQIPENFRYVPLMTLNEARRAFRDTVLGLEYLHYQGVIHRDIKPANLLQAASGHIKISDFGVSYLGKDKTEPFPNGEEASEYEGEDAEAAIELAKTVGTPAFYAPELCQTDCDPEADAPPVSHQIDIWALGVTLYCLIYGRVPFYDENTFHLMHLIASSEPYIPPQRLKAVDTQSNSRPSSHGRTWSQPVPNKRLEHQLVYESVDDELMDLLKRMLIKDPRRRISLYEIKHHSWLVRDLQDPVRWLDDTDPNNFTSGRRIEISKEDVDVAVVQLTIVERAKSVARKVGEVFGISKKSSSRKRAESSATNTSDRSNPASAASSSSTISQDARRQRELRRPSVKPEDPLYAALKSATSTPYQHPHEHPLSQSVTASPEPKEQVEFFPGPEDSSPDSPVSILSQSSNKPRPPHLRPATLDRAQSTISTTGSVRTVRPGDIGLNTGAATLPALPSTPMEMNTPSSLSGIFGGAKQKLLSTVRQARDRSSGRHGRSSPVERVTSASADPHAHASLAVSEAVAAGQVNAPSYMIEGSTTGSSVNSIASSRNPSVSSHLHLEPTTASEAALSRNSSVSSLASRNRGRSRAGTSANIRPHSAYLPLLGDGAHDNKPSPKPSESSQEVVESTLAKAQEEQMRRRLQESQYRPASSLAHSRQPSTVDEECPPSPDDVAAWRKAIEQESQQQESYFGNIEPLPEPAHPHLVSSSSEDHFTSMSQSTSNPSIPSVASAGSSLPAEEGIFLAEHISSTRKESQQSQAADGVFISVDQRAIYEAHHQDDYSYDGDHAVESDDDDDSDDSFIEMSRTKSRAQGLTRSESISNAELQLHRERRQTGENQSVKSARSGSNNTMKKIRSRTESDDEVERPRPMSAI